MVIVVLRSQQYDTILDIFVIQYNTIYFQKAKRLLPILEVIRRLVRCYGSDHARDSFNEYLDMIYHELMSRASFRRMLVCLPSSSSQIIHPRLNQV